MKFKCRKTLLTAGVGLGLMAGVANAQYESDDLYDALERMRYEQEQQIQRDRYNRQIDRYNDALQDYHDQVNQFNQDRRNFNYPSEYVPLFPDYPKAPKRW